MIDKNKLQIIKVDIVRAFLSWKFVISVVLGILVCYFTLLFCGNYKSDTIHKFIMLHDRSQSFLAYIVGIISYALCFFDDFAYGNIRNIVGRINIKSYIFSKTAVAITSTICAFIMGKLLFVGIYSFNSPICLPETLSRIPSDILYTDLIEKQNYISYFFMTSIHKAFYCAILCQVVMLISIVIPNKAVVFSIPVAVFYVLNFYINSIIGSSAFNFSRIFDGITRIWRNDIFGFCYTLIIALLTYYILYRLTFRVMRKKVYDE